MKNTITDKLHLEKTNGHNRQNHDLRLTQNNILEYTRNDRHPQE